jgi:hypothetical protein
MRIGGSVALCVLTLGAVALSGGDVNRATAARATTRGSCPSPSGETVVQTVHLPGIPRGTQLTRHTLWVAIGGSRPGRPGRLVRLDARSGRVLRTFRLPVDPSRVALGFGSLWITGEAIGERGGLLRVDPRTGNVVRNIHGPRNFGTALATTSDAVWVGGADSFPAGRPEETLARWIFKIDPRRNAVVRRVRLAPTTVITLLGEGSSLWATGWGAVVKVSTSGKLLLQRRFDGSGWALTRAADALWIAKPFAGTRASRQRFPARQLLRITTSPPHRLTVLELDSQPGAISAAAGFVWMTAAPGVVRIDGTRTPPTLTGVALPGESRGVRASPEAVWVTQHNPNAVSKIC